MGVCEEALREVEGLLSRVEDFRVARVLGPEDELRLRAILYRLGQLREEPVDEECAELLEYARRVVGDILRRAGLPPG